MFEFRPTLNEKCLSDPPQLKFVYQRRKDESGHYNKMRNLDNPALAVNKCQKATYKLYICKARQDLPKGCTTEHSP